MTRVKAEKCSPKSEYFMAEVLKRMEKMIDEKLSSLKTFIPILFTVITSVLAFLFVQDVSNEKVMKSYAFIIIFLLLAFISLVLSYFVKNYYRAEQRKTDIDFSPYNLKSYCFLSDKEFLRKLSGYAKRPLTEKELVVANFIKQKINEYVTRRTHANFALFVVIVGVFCIVGMFLVYIFTL